MWPCTLYVDTLDEAVRYQEALVSDLEDRCNVLEIKEDGKRVGWLKNVVARFNNGESLDATFTLTYEVAYKRKGWDASTPHRRRYVYQTGRKTRKIERKRKYGS